MSERSKNSEHRWTSTDVLVVELLALGSGMLFASILATIGWLWDHPSLIVAPGIGGLLITIRAVVRARRRPWWNYPTPHP